jgi:hypothetical protein
MLPFLKLSMINLLKACLTAATLALFIVYRSWPTVVRNPSVSKVAGFLFEQTGAEIERILPRGSIFS